MVRGAGFEPAAIASKIKASRGMTHGEAHELAEMIDTWVRLDPQVRLHALGLLKAMAKNAGDKSDWLA